MMRRCNYLFLATCLVAVLLAGCANDHELGPNVNPRDPATGGLKPPVPADVTVSTGNRQLTVSWELPDSSLADDVGSYRVYRRGLLSDEYVLAASPVASPATIDGISNGLPILVSVSAVLTNGLEGERSTEAGATPGLFAVAIEEGRAATRSREVFLFLTAPGGTSAVMVSSSPDMAEAVTRDYQTVVGWTLPDGDGEKTVYARFVDGEGNHSEIVSDSISLDTRAEIIDFYFEGSDTREPGDVIIFRMVTGEAGGTANVQLGSGGPWRLLRDDGVDPDLTGGDGIYSLAYEAEKSLQFINAEMLGLFIDEAGNTAPQRPASSPLTIHAPPPALVLEEPTSSGPQQITLSWSRVPEGIPFSSYRLYRAEAPGVDTLESRRLVVEIPVASVTSHTDTGVAPETDYYYLVELVDPYGSSTASNEVSGRARDNDPPGAVILDQPTQVTTTSVSLSWSRSYADDFYLYRVVRGDAPGVADDPLRRVVTEIPVPVTTTHVDYLEIEEGKTYYYVVEVVDALEAATPSNEVSATVEDDLPTAVVLTSSVPAGETTVSLSWSPSLDLDFQSYEAYRSESPGVNETNDLVVSITEIERIQWIDSGLRENTDYYYSIYVRDKGDHATGSNELFVTTANVDPAPVTLATPVEVAGEQTPSVDLSWTVSTEHDFESYRIHRDTSPVVGEDAYLVRVIDNSSITSYRDAGLSDNTRYYYRVLVRDTAFGTTSSNEESVITDNRAPTPVSLDITSTTSSSISLAWTPSVDADFLQYQLRRGNSPGAISTVVATFPHREQTTYSDYLPGQNPNQDLFYKVVVYDSDIDGVGSLTSDSNIVSGRVGSK